jgi:hypothetical protein
MFKLKPLRPVICLFALFLVLNSCENVKRKGAEMANETEQKVKDRSRDLLDKVHPRFDADQADTEYNKERFRDFLRVELTADVKYIYCFASEMGIDAAYQFSFTCDTATVQRIILQHQLKRDPETTDFGFAIQRDFEWWDKKKIGLLPLYSWNIEARYFKYFWYNARERKAYYFEFDL